MFYKNRYNKYNKFNKYSKYKKFNRYSHKKYPKINMKLNVVFVKRTSLTELTVDDSGFQALVIAGRSNDYRLGDIPNYQDIANMYDEYKMCGIKHKFVFERNSAEVNTTNKIMPTLITVNDFNTQAALTTEGQALEYSSCKISRLDQVTTRYFRPKAQIKADGTDTAIAKSVWINTDTDNCPHLGLLGTIVTSGAGINVLGVLKIYTTYYIACRRAK